VIDRPETRYAWNGDVALAYQVAGDGPIDLVYLQGFCSNIDMHWESPYLARFLEGLGKFGRLIVTDRRGWGCSDRFSPTDVPPFETLVEDLPVVLDAVRSERAVLVSSYENCSLVMLFAATHPERCAGLVMIDPWASWFATDETPWMGDDADWEGTLRDLHDRWGSERWDPSFPAGPERDWYVRYQRASITPGSVVAEFRAYMRTDVRAILPSIRVPSLVLSSTTGEGGESPESGRLIAERIPGARRVEVAPPVDDLSSFHWYGRAPAILEEIGAFVSRLWEEAAAFDRVLATVLFTDIVDSTATAATMGDARWKALIAEHDTVAKRVVERFRGEYVKSTGDGLLATFDGPARAIRCAEALLLAMEPLGIEIRAGLHTGEIEHGGADLAGIGVHIGARVGALAGASEVWVSSTVKDLVAGSGLVFEDAGEHELKGVPDSWRLYRVVA
jgi:class 3 adenylate cyclase/pimeloyl-ACP methyl ester carboxylesterase